MKLFNVRYILNACHGPAGLIKYRVTLYLNSIRVSTVYVLAKSGVYVKIGVYD